MKKHYIFRQVLAGMTALLLGAQPLLAVSAGSSGGDFLLRSPHALQAGLSEAVSSLSAEESGVSQVYYNPASTAFLDSFEVSGTGQRGFAQDNFGAFALGTPLSFGKVTGILSYYTSGNVDLIDSSGNTSSVTGQQDLMIGSSYSDFFYERVGMGVTLKYIHSQLLQTSKASAVALDGGFLMPFFDRKLLVGGSLLNVGSSLQFQDVSDSLPLTYRVGTSYRFPFLDRGNVLVSLDLTQTLKDKVYVPLGVELNWKHLFYVRGGYKLRRDVGRWSFGFGILAIGGNSENSERKVSMDYALVEGSDLGATHTFSVAYKFKTNLGRVVKVRQKPKKQLLNQVAVLPFKAGEDVKQEQSAYIADLLRSKLTGRHPNVNILEKHKVLSSLKRAYRNCADSSCASKFGQEVGITRVIVGTVEKIEDIYDVRVDIVNTVSGRIEYSDSASYAQNQDPKLRLQSMAERMIYILK